MDAPSVQYRARELMATAKRCSPRVLSPPIDSPLDDRALRLSEPLFLVSASCVRNVDGELRLDGDVVLERDVIHLRAYH